jgi:hypothetical protein
MLDNSQAINNALPVGLAQVVNFAQYTLCLISK